MSDVMCILEGVCPDCGNEFSHTSVEVHPDNVNDWIADEIIERPYYARSFGHYDLIMTGFTGRCDTCNRSHYVEQSAGSGDWS